MTDTTVDIGGTVAPGYEGVRDAFEQNFREHSEVGAGYSLYVDGHEGCRPVGRHGRPLDRRAVHRGHLAAGVLHDQGRDGRVR